MRRTFPVLALIAAVCAVSGCGGGSPAATVPAAPPDAAGPATVISQAASSDITLQSTQAGVTPFIAFAQFSGTSLASVQSVSYLVTRKPGAVSLPVLVTFTIDALTRRGYVQPAALKLPIFGLYSGRINTVLIALQFGDGSVQLVSRVVVTAPYTDPNGIYDQPVIIKGRTPGDGLGFNYFAMKSNLGTPVVVDTDGEIRWVGTGVASAVSSVLTGNAFVIGDPTSMTAYRLELDGSVVTVPLTSASYTTFHHNIDLGRDGLLAEVNSTVNTESTIAEFTTATGFSKEWDFARLLSDYMISQGDDPSTFVRPGADWFHSNAATYDPRDNSLIVSSRENFIIKVDYDSGNIIWILGDPAKYWYTFPSLRAKALSLNGTGLYPIGQHATSITSSGSLMVFNDGFPSLNQPAGAPKGASRSFSAVSAYQIDLATRTATEVYRFDYGQAIFSAVCSSAYEAPNNSVLVDYAWDDLGTNTRLVGLNSSQNVAFDFQYVNKAGCNTSWNAVPIPLENMQFN
jgi:arylsulfate sulfotransferase